MSVSVVENGFSFNFNGKQYNYSYARIRERVRRVTRENPEATIGEQLHVLAREFSEDYAAGVGISKDEELVKGVTAIILAHLFEWFSEFIRSAIDRVIHVGRALYDMIECFFEWLFGLFT